MRPLRVEMVGFSAFREPTTVDFADVDLAALWGPTGSGKSTIVDAVTFALYGSVARYDDDRLVAPVINQLSTEARVKLDFEVAGDEYSAVRVLRRTKTGATTKEARLEYGLEVLAGSQREMGPAVQQLLGMDFEQFTKTVVLPQGEFAAFLHDKPSERQKLLRQLLELGIYARMGETARAQARTAQTKLETITEHLATGEDITDEQLGALTARVKELAKLRKKLTTETDKLAALSTEVDELAAADARMERELERLQSIAIPEEVVTFDKELSEATGTRDAAAKAAKAARAALAKAEKAVEDGPDAAQCQRMLEDYEERAELEETLTKLGDALSGAGEALGQAQAAADEARATCDELHEQLQAALLAAGAAGFRAALVVGEPCPVCEQVVTDVPSHDVDKELAAAEKRHERALAAFEKSDQLRAKAHAAHAQTNAELKAARKQKLGLDKKLDGAPTSKRLEADLEKASQLAQAQVEARAAADDAAAEHEATRAAVENLEKSERALRRELGAARDSVSELEPPQPVGESLHRDWLDLTKWAASITTKVEKARASSAGKLDTKTQQRNAKQRAIDDLCEPHVQGETPTNLIEFFAEAATRAEADFERAEKRHEELTKMRAQVGDLENEAKVAGELGRLLQATGFERWLMEEAVVDLVERATDRLLELSNGQYSLIAHETAFRVQDHRNADEVRDARTLSGGETFLASLSLALALADSIADLAPEGSPRLESIFLDEGFGTLDPETLDIVASAIEELGAAGRMVAIVTHIRELADRMPVRFEVSKEATSSSVERVEV